MELSESEEKMMSSNPQEKKDRSNDDGGIVCRPVKTSRVDADGGQEIEHTPSDNEPDRTPVPPPPSAVDTGASSTHISPLTPMPQPVRIPGVNSDDTPATVGSYDSLLLAAMYQTSRRSRTSTPGTGTPAQVLQNMNMQQSSGGGGQPGLPPPPLYSSGEIEDVKMNAAQQLSSREGVAEAGAIDVHKVSGLSGSHSSWGTSYASLMNSMNSSQFRDSASTAKAGNTWAEAGNTAAQDSRPGRKKSQRSGMQMDHQSLVDYKIIDSKYPIQSYSVEPSPQPSC